MAINLRKLAKGKECQIRIPGVCNHNPETTVLCHLNNKRLFGVDTGQKVPDIFGAWGCSACHDECDNRTKKYDKTGWNRLIEIKIMFYEGCLRTMNILLNEGIIGEIK